MISRAFGIHTKVVVEATSTLKPISLVASEFCVTVAAAGVVEPDAAEARYAIPQNNGYVISPDGKKSGYDLPATIEGTPPDRTRPGHGPTSPEQAAPRPPAAPPPGPRAGPGRPACRLQFWTDLINKYHVSPTLQMTDTEPNQMFGAGKVAMYYGDSWGRVHRLQEDSVREGER